MNSATLVLCVVMGVVSGLPQFGQRQQLQGQQPQSFQGQQSFQPQQFQGQQSFQQPQSFQGRQSFQQPQQFQGQQSFAPVQYLDEQPHTYIPILSKSEVRRPDGTFDLKYQSADGQDFAEKAVVQRSQDNTGDVLVKSGHYAYTAPDGTPIAVSYIADEFGFRATGSHIPVAPAATA
ncbi:hypothetical protein M8J76_016754 [Diaphorina citri]|nr:hypothetical protein M8J75_009749 [Diaphorina citri]KAI5719929.1 hypothetical protein M8J76_016754 [Diaphorina citri]